MALEIPIINLGAFQFQFSRLTRKKRHIFYV